jgi:hypothetical protein
MKSKNGYGVPLANFGLQAYRSVIFGDKSQIALSSGDE